MKYYRNVITVEVLSNEPWDDEITDLAVVDRETDEGGSIGYVTRTVINEEITREEAVGREHQMGGDGGFISWGEAE